MHLANGTCSRCHTIMTALSDETGILEVLDVKCATCRQGRVSIEVRKDPTSDTIVPTMKVRQPPAVPTAIVRIRLNGDVDYLRTAGVELIVVDQRTPADRAYRISDEGIECQTDVEKLTGEIVGSKAEACRHGGENTGDCDG